MTLGDIFSFLTFDKVFLKLTSNRYFSSGIYNNYSKGWNDDTNNNNNNKQKVSLNLTVFDFWLLNFESPFIQSSNRGI